MMSEPHPDLPPWPQHEDGTNKTIAEMTAAERRAQIKAAEDRFRAKRNAEIAERY